MAKKVKKAAKPEVNEETRASVEPPVDGKVQDPTGVEGKVKRGKVGHRIEISVKVPGYVPKASEIVDIDKLDAAGRATVLDHLVDELAVLMR